MEVRVAKSAGFCFGVTKAVELLDREIHNNKDNNSIYTWGPIIHNKEVIRSYEEQGVRVFNNEDELAESGKGTVVIRAHGVAPEIYEALEKAGLRVVDGTCPFVKRIHRIVSEEVKAGRFVVIVGNPDHPEVKGIQGWCRGQSAVVRTPKEFRALIKSVKTGISVVAQTTFNSKKFKEFVEIAEDIEYDIFVHNTICNATHIRQEEAGNMAAENDVMLVIGDASSSNTQKLYEICKAKNSNTHHIETSADIDNSWFNQVQRLGITAGASTPNNIIMEVQNKCRN